MAPLCREHHLNEQVVPRWRAVFFARAELLFRMETAQDGHLTCIAALECVVGRLTMELDLAKTASQLWGSRATSSGS